MVKLGAIYRLCVSVCLCVFVSVCQSVCMVLFKLHESAHWIVSFDHSARLPASVVRSSVPTVQQRR